MVIYKYKNGGNSILPQITLASVLKIVEEMVYSCYAVKKIEGWGKRL